MALPARHQDSVKYAVTPNTPANERIVKAHRLNEIVPPLGARVDLYPRRRVRVPCHKTTMDGFERHFPGRGRRTRVFVGKRRQHIAARPNNRESAFRQEPDKTTKRESPPIWEGQKIVQRQRRRIPGTTNRVSREDRRAVPRVILAIGDAQREQPAGPQQGARRVQRRARIRELIEGVPDDDRVQWFFYGEGFERSRRGAKAEAVDKRDRALVHVESLEGEAGVTSGGKERSRVAAHLETARRHTGQFTQQPQLPIVRALLTVVDPPKRLAIERGLPVDPLERGGALGGISIERAAFDALYEANRRRLRENRAVVQAA